MESFRKELEALINKHSLENGSDTPDFLLATYMVSCLENYNNIIQAREKHYGRGVEVTDIPVDEGIIGHNPATTSYATGQGEFWKNTND